MSSYNESLADAIEVNTRRYANLFSDIIGEMLPTFQHRQVFAKDALDVYIEHRRLMESRLRPGNEQRDERNCFPPELMKRLYVVMLQSF